MAKQVISPFGGSSVLSGEAGGVQLDGTTQPAGMVPTTTGNQAAPYSFQALPSASGTVTSVAVADAHGFRGSVANPTTTPVISMETDVVGLLKGDGTGVTAAVPGTDYLAPGIGQSIMVVTTAPVIPGGSAAVPSGLSINVAAGDTYVFEIEYFLQVTTTQANTLNLNSGTATATSVEGWAQNLEAGGPQSGAHINSYASTFAGTLAAGTNFAQYVTGTIVVNAAGSFEPGYATVAASTNELLPGSWMRLTRVS